MGSIPTRSRHPGLRRPAAVLVALAAALVLAASGPSTASAQEPAGPDTAAAGGAPPAPGSAAQPDTTPSPPISPFGAFARSVVVPGWGQAEVGRPVRGAIYFAAQSASLWMVFKTQTKLSAAERGAAQDSSLVASRVSQRENWIVLSAFWALMSGVDAWVSTHFYGFEGQLEPPEDGTPGAQVSYRIPLDLP